MQNDSKTVTAKEDVKQKFSSLVLIKLKFLRILNSSVDPRTSDDVLKL